MFRYIVGGALVFVITYAVLYFTWHRMRSGSGKSRRRWPALLAAIVTGAYLFMLPAASNHSTAILEPSGDKFKITFTGDRLEQGTDFWSKLRPSIITDTFWVVVKRTEGRITGKDIASHKGDFHMFGKIEMKEKSLTVELYFDNAANRTTDPLEWNGSYELVRGTNDAQR